MILRSVVFWCYNRLPNGTIVHAHNFENNNICLFVLSMCEALVICHYSSNPQKYTVTVVLFFIPVPQLKDLNFKWKFPGGLKFD